MGIHMGSGYGSEFQLMRVMGRYRNKFNRHVEHEVGGQLVQWLDMIPGGKYDVSNKEKIYLPDNEYKGLNFLSTAEYDRISLAWENFWPQTGNIPNWDAVGRVKIKGTDTWLLVEAKAHVEEMKSDCTAGKTSKSKIQEAFEKTKASYNFRKPNDWTKSYYQMANRLAMAYFLNKECHIPTILLFIYFCGDHNTAENPDTVQEWKTPISSQDKHLGLTEQVKAEIGCYTLFWHVAKGPLQKSY